MLLKELEEARGTVVMSSDMDEVESSNDVTSSSAFNIQHCVTFRLVLDFNTDFIIL